MTDDKPKTLGSAIDAILTALEGLDQPVQITAIRAVSQHLNLPGPPAALLEGEELGSGPAAPSAAADIRSIKNQKNPSSIIEMVCVMGYYLQHLAPSVERKDRFDVSDISKYFIQAGFQLPKVARQVLVDAKDAGYLDALGGGQYRLNAVGHNLVSHTLPRTTGAISESKPRGRSGRRASPVRGKRGK